MAQSTDSSWNQTGKEAASQKNKSGNTSNSGKQLKRLLSKLSLRSALTLFLNNYNCKCQIAIYIKINLLSMMPRQPKKMSKKLHNLGVELLLSIDYGALSSSHGQTWFVCLPWRPLTSTFNQKPKSSWDRPKNSLQLNPDGALFMHCSSGQIVCHVPQSNCSSINSWKGITHQWISVRKGADSLPWKQVKGHIKEEIVSLERLQRSVRSSSLVWIPKVSKCEKNAMF